MVYNHSEFIYSFDREEEFIVIYQKYLNINMNVEKRRKEVELGERQENWEQSIERIKLAAFEVMHVHLRETIVSGTNAYRCIVALEQLSLLAFVLHPVLQVYGDVAGAQPLQTVLTALNFHEFLRTNSSLATPLVAAVLGFLLLQLAVIAVSALGVVRRWKWEYLGLLRKAAHFLFLLTAKALAGPFLALSITVLYCSSSSPYHAAQQCYAGEHLAQATGAAVAVLLVGAQVLLLGLLYFVRDPLAGGYLCEKNHYYVLSKTLMKLLFPLYFALDSARTFEAQFLYAAAALWAVYLFWHRLNSLHSYDPRHYLFEYALEAVVFWAAVKNIILLYTADGPLQTRFGLLSTFVEGGMLGSVLAALERWLSETRLRDGVRKKIKKQQFEPFFVSLVSAFVHETSQKAAIWFDVYSKLLGRDKALEDREKLRQTECKSQEGLVKRVQDFLRQIIKEWLKEKDSFLLRCAEVHLLAKAGQKHYALYRALELGTRKNSLGDQFALFALKAAAGLPEDSTRRNPDEFLRVYRYHRESELFEDLVLAAARNNFDFWEELSESEPSLSRVCGLAARYSRLEQLIAEQYTLLSTIKENKQNATKLYIDFLKNVGVNSKLLQHARENFTSKSTFNFLSNQHLLTRYKSESILTVGSIGGDLGVIFNCNSQATRLLNYTTEALLGKNVSKMMPEVFSRLHNLFLFNFISTNHDFSKTVEKVVPAMTRDSLIVEIRLRIKLLYYRQGEMILVGMMQKLNEDDGFIMFDAETQQIMGINGTLVQMMRERLTGPQVIHEDIKLSMIFPELSMQELLGDEKRVATALDINCLNEKVRFDTQTRKGVIITIKQFIKFESIKIGFLQVSQNKTFNSLITLRRNHTVKSVHSLQYQNEEEQKNEKEMTSTIKKHPRRKPIASINLLKRSKQSQRHQQNSLSVHLQEFIKSKQAGKSNIISLLIIFLSITLTIGIAILISRSFQMYLNFTSEIFTNADKQFDIAYSNAQINLHVAKIWNTSILQKNPGFQSLIPLLGQQISEIGFSLKTAREYIDMYPNSEEIFRIYQNYNLTLIKIDSQNIEETTLSMSGFDCISAYVSAAERFMSLVTKTVEESTRLLIQQQGLFVHKNGQQMIPAIPLKTIQEFSTQLDLQTKALLDKRLLLTAIILSELIFFIFMMMVLMRNIKQTNIEAVNFINLIQQTQAQKEEEKCFNFLNIKQKTSSFNRRPSRCLKSSNKALQPLRSHKTNLEEKNSETEMLSLDFDGKKGLVTEKETETVNEAMISEETRLKENEEGKKVNLDFTVSYRKMVGTIVLILIFFVGICFFSQIFVTNILNNFPVFQKEYTKVGMLDHSLEILNYYSFRLTHNSSDQIARELLKNEIKLFFTIKFSDEMLTLMEPILVKAYSVVQTLQSWLAVPGMSSSGILMADYSKIDQALSDSSSKIHSLKQSVLKLKYSHFYEASSTFQIVFVISSLLGISFLFLFIYWNFIRKANRQNKKLLNLLRMIPHGLLFGNNQLKSIILRYHH